MLKEIGFASMEALMEEVIPDAIKLKDFSALEDGHGKALSQKEFLNYITALGNKNQVYKSYIGLGYYNCFLPPVIQRSLLENPGWYTQYTPYQAEISQGRLESLLNFQTMITELSGLPVANASLLDEGTAAAEAMFMAYRIAKANRNKIFISNHLFPQTIDIIKTRAHPLKIEIEIGDLAQATINEEYFAVVVQYPAENGEIYNYLDLVKELKEKNILVIGLADILSLTLLKPPGEWGVDIAVGSTQRLGVPLGYGGPHAAYLSTKEEYKRFVPGRIIGVTKDKFDNVAFRMSLQTREQHIRREKANSNICTAQALLANIAAMYVIYHGREGVKKIALNIHYQTKYLADCLSGIGYSLENRYYFDTITIKDDPKVITALHEKANENLINFRQFPNNDKLGISLDETASKEEIKTIINLFKEIKRGSFNEDNIQIDFSTPLQIPEALIRKSDFLTHEIFNTIHSETQMLRYLNYLEKKDLSLNTSMIPLGSCTMKLNAAVEMSPISFKNFSEIHPYAPLAQTQGYQEIFNLLEKSLEKITGLDKTSLQPNSGAQGEYAGLLAIRNYFIAKNEKHRNVALIPSSAHGTNPASAILAGMKVVIVSCLENGDTDLADLEKKAKEHSENLAALMITYPSTHGVFEPKIKEICDLIHRYKGQVYMDGANLNAQVGYTSPGIIGADVCHINLHKTFAIPHGGGGPGMGPIVVKKHLIPFLPGNPLIPIEGRQNNSISAAPWGSASILIISLGYLKLLGDEGVKKSTAYSILNANYIKKRLEKYYPVLFTSRKGLVAHELIIDIRNFISESNIQAEDVAKRLMDFGFHAPTMSWPVANTLMIEPTESEDKEEIDRFCDALIAIRKEIEDIKNGKLDKENNPLKNAPHSMDYISDEKKQPYSTEQAFFPLPYVKKRKFWPSVARIDNAYGDRNFYCTCPPLEDYQ